MKLRIFSILVLLLGYLTVEAQGSKDRLLLFNVNIINVVDGSLRKNAAIAIGDGKILGIGNYKTLKKKFATSTVIDGQN